MASNRIRGNTKNKTIILDTSAILMLFEFSINLEDELQKLVGKYEIKILTPVFNELKIISKQGDGKKNKNAKAALKLITKYPLIEVEGKGDDAIIEFAKKNKCMVITNDKQLRKRLKEISTKSIFLKTKKILDID